MDAESTQPSSPLSLDSPVQTRASRFVQSTLSFDSAREERPLREAITNLAKSVAALQSHADLCDTRLADIEDRLSEIEAFLESECPSAALADLKVSESVCSSASSAAPIAKKPCPRSRAERRESSQ